MEGKPIFNHLNRLNRTGLGNRCYSFLLRNTQRALMVSVEQQSNCLRGMKYSVLLLASVTVFFLQGFANVVLANSLSDKKAYDYKLFYGATEIGASSSISGLVAIAKAHAEPLLTEHFDIVRPGWRPVGTTQCGITHLTNKHEIGCTKSVEYPWGTEWLPDSYTLIYLYQPILADSPCNGPECCKGEPCNIATGGQIEKEVDSRSPDGFLKLTRVYQSRNASELSSFGAGWTAPYNKKLDLSEEGAGVVTLQGSSGYNTRFTEDPANPGQWIGKAGTIDKLTENASYFILKRADGGQEYYSIAQNGRLSQEYSSNWLLTQHTYTSSPQTLTIQGPFGRELVYTYGSAAVIPGGQIDSVTLPDGTSTITYEYNGTNLTRVNYPDGTAKLYYYEDLALPNHLTGIAFINSSGVETRHATFAYDSVTGRAISNELAETDNGSPQEKFTFSYDNDFQVTVTDAENNQEVTVFDESPSVGSKRVQSQTDLGDNKGFLKKYDDATNTLTCRQDAEGNITTYTYNTNNQRTSKTEGQGGTCDALVAIAETRTTTFEYKYPNLNLKTFVRTPSVSGGSNQFATETRYDHQTLTKSPTSVIQSGFKPDGTAVPNRQVSLQYNTVVKKISQIDGPRTAVTDTTILTYYECTTGGACGQLKDVTNAKGHVTNFNAYYPDGRLQTLTDANGLVTDYTYDPRGRVATLTQTPPAASGLAARTTSYTYTAFGEVDIVTTADGIVLDYDYDAAQDLRSITDNLGNRIEYDYDLRGNRSDERVRDPSGLLVRNVIKGYDLRNRLDSINNDSALTTFVNDALGNRTQVTDPNNNDPANPGPVSTITTLDALNRIDSVQDTLSGLTDYGYNVHDRLTRVVAPNSATTDYIYDDLGNLLQETGPDRGTITYSHDPAGNITTKTDARGTITSYAYDELNRLVSINYLSDTDVTYVYDSCAYGVGRLCQKIDASGTTTYTYDPFGNIVTKSVDDSGTVETTYYTYDAGNRIQTSTLPGGRVITHTRDALGRVTNINDGATTFLDQIQYQADGLITDAVWGNGLTLAQDYNLRGELLKTSSFDLSFIDGDWNGDGVLNAGDLVLAERTVLGTYTPTLEQSIRGDVYPPGNPDGQITVPDFLILIRAIHGLTTLGGGT